MPRLDLSAQRARLRRVAPASTERICGATSSEGEWCHLPFGHAGYHEADDGVQTCYVVQFTGDKRQKWRRKVDGAVTLP